MVTTDQMTTALAPNDLIVVGKIFDSYGLQGWVKINPFEDSQVSALLQADHWWIQRAGKTEWASVNASGARAHTSAILAKLDCCVTREDALALKGASLGLSRSLFPKPADAEFYWVDLAGCAVTNREGLLLGNVRMVDHHGAHAILYVASTKLAEGAESAEERLIPFVAAYIDKVDIAQKQIVVDWQLDY